MRNVKKANEVRFMGVEAQAPVVLVYSIGRLEDYFIYAIDFRALTWDGK